MATGAPVDDIVSAIDQALFVQLDKDRPHGLGQPLIHGKALPVPIARSPKALQLFDDQAAVFFPPLPDPFDELFTSEAMPVFPFSGQLLFHHVLGSDSCVVHTRHPQHVIPLHATVPT